MADTPKPPKPTEEAIALWKQRRAAKQTPAGKPGALDTQRVSKAMAELAEDGAVQLSGTLERTAGNGGTVMVRLDKPWKGLKSIPATAIDGCTGHKKVVVFKTKEGGWAALGKGTERLTQQREAGRSATGLYRPITGRVAYLCLALVGKHPDLAPGAIPSLDQELWTWTWQVWLGGLAADMMLVREWQIYRAPGDSSPRFWERATVPEAVLDLRAEEFYVSLKWVEKLPTDSVPELRWGLFKGNPDAVVNDAGLPADGIETVWSKKDSEFSSPRPSTLNLTCAGFGYWTAGVIGAITPPAKTWRLQDGQLYSLDVQAETIIGSPSGDGNDGAAYPITQTNTAWSKAYTFVGGDNTEEAGFNNTTTYIAYVITNPLPTVLSLNYVERRITLFRVAQDGSQGLLWQEVYTETRAGTQTSMTRNSSLTRSLDDFEFRTEAVNDVQISGGGGSYTREIKGTYEDFNLPGLLRDPDGKTDTQVNQLLKTVIAVSPFSATTTGHRFDSLDLLEIENLTSDANGIVYPASPSYSDVTDTYTRGLLTSTATRRVFNPAVTPQTNWFYPGLYQWSDENTRSRLFCDVYPSQFVSCISSPQLVGRSPANITPLWKIFPELRPATAPAEPGKTPQQLLDEDDAAMQNIEHADRTCNVRLRTYTLGGDYKQGTIEVQVLKAKQILQIVSNQASEQPTRMLAKYQFVNASFGADQ